MLVKDIKVEKNLIEVEKSKTRIWPETIQDEKQRFVEFRKRYVMRKNNKVAKKSFRSLAIIVKT